MLKTFYPENSITPPEMLYFDIQRFATGTAIKISGVIKNVEVGDTFTVDDAKYTILTVEEKSVTAIVEGTPTTDFGKEIVISDNKSIEGATIETSETSDVDSKISTKYTYKLDIGGNSVFVIIYENAIESVKDSDGNPLSASGDNYTVGTINFALSLDNGIPNATYNGTSSVAAVLDTTTYSFSVDSAQVGTAAGTYSVGTQQLKLSYANGSLTAQNASSVSPTISSVATYIVGDTTVTVDSSGQLSQTTATVNGQTATLTYSAETKKITASYTVSTAGDSDTYTVTLPDKSTVTVKVESGAISSVTYNNKEITATEGKYSVTTTGGTNYTLSLNYADSNLTATATTIIDELTATQNYTVALGDDSIAITVKDSKLYQGDTELSATNDVYTVKVGSKEVKLKYDATNGLQVATNVVDLSTLTADYEAKDGDILTGKPGSYKISIADGATVTLSGVNINVTDIEAAGIACNGSATIILEGTNTVKGAENFAGIQAGNKDTTLTIEGTGSLTAKGGDNGAGIGSGFSNEGNNTCGAITISGGAIFGDKVKDLSTLTADYEAKDGDILTGKPGSYKISITDGATVTLCDVTINGNGASGITCLGNATIILEGTNTVTGASNYAGIKAGVENTTLTIKGTGSLDATGSRWGAGIGSGNNGTCGNIVIDSGTITATGGSNGAGIGNGCSSDYGTNNTCGNIVIESGTVTAKGGDFGAGIGSGSANGSDVTSECGNITINGGTVTANGGDQAAGIGSGFAHKGNSTCGNIVIESGTVTAKGGDFGAGIGSGSANGSDVTSECGDIIISGGTVTAKGGNQVAGIGNGQSDDASFSPCGNITITNTVTKVTATKSNSAEGSIRTYNGTVTIGGKTGAKTEDTYT